MKRSKKILSMALAAAMSLSMMATALATSAGQSQSGTKDVTGSFQASTKNVLSVDYSIGSMKFTYSDGSNAGTWDPNTHSYNGASSDGEAGWYSTEAARKIKVTNHSNCPMTITCEFTPALSGFKAGFFDGDTNIRTFTLPSAEGTTVANAPSKTIEFAVTTDNTATLTSGQTNIKLGTINLTSAPG